MCASVGGDVTRRQLCVVIPCDVHCDVCNGVSVSHDLYPSTITEYEKVVLDLIAVVAFLDISPAPFNHTYGTSIMYVTISSVHARR